MSKEAVQQSIQSYQAEAQQLLMQSAYEWSLMRYHKECAEQKDKEIDHIAKKIRNLEAQMPKTKLEVAGGKDESKEIISGNIHESGSMGAA